MAQFRYSQSIADHTMFMTQIVCKITQLMVYVDNIVVTGNDINEINKLKACLAKEFNIKDLGQLR